MTATEAALHGKSVLITRPRGRGGALAARLEEAGARVILKAAIEFEPASDPGPADEAVANLDGYRWIVFTSSTGVRFLGARAREAGIGLKAAAARFAAVGPGTAAALEAEGVRPALVPSRSDAEGLGAELAGELRPGDPVLVVRPEISRQFLAATLRKTGARVDAVAFYRTVPSRECGEIVAAIRGDMFDAVVFTSPSTFLSLVERAGPDRQNLLGSLDRIKRVAIGPVTASALADQGMKPHAIASAPTDAAVLDALARALGGEPVC